MGILSGESGLHPVVESLACFTCPARQSDICGGLNDAEIRELASSSSRIQLKPGETLIWDGDASQHTYIVTRGTLRASKASNDGRRQILDFLFAGQFIGIPSDLIYHFNAEALTEAEVCRFDRRKLEGLMARHPAVEKGYRSGTARQLETGPAHRHGTCRRVPPRPSGFKLPENHDGRPQVADDAWRHRRLPRFDAGNRQPGLQPH
jgi:hypothetical protein